MKHLYPAAKQLQKLAKDQRWAYCIIGGVAVGRWGEVRATQDVNATVYVEIGREHEVIEPLFEAFTIREDHDKQKALISRVMLLESEDGIGLDVSLASSGFEEQAVRRATWTGATSEASSCACTASWIGITFSKTSKRCVY